MKKSMFTVIFILTAFFVSAQNAVIERVTGTVEIRQPGDVSFRSAGSGDEIFQDTVISTGFKSFAVVISGGTTITVRPLTMLTLKEIQKSAETETLNVNLRTGRVRVDVKPPAGARADFIITSPTTTASVRGTTFEFDTGGLYVSEGTVEFGGNRGQNVFIGAGESSRIEQTGRVTSSIEERNAKLLPPSSVGAGAGDSGSSGSVAANGGSYSVQLVFD